MNQSILFIKILAVYFIISGIFLLVKGKTLPLIWKDFFNHPAIIYLTGVILIFLGTGVLIGNNVFDQTLHILTAIFGWLVLLKGLAYVFMPKTLEEISLKKFNSWFGILGVILLALGVYLFFLI